MTADELIAKAYDLDQVQRNRAAAVQALREGMKDLALKDGIVVERQRLAGVVQARSYTDGRCGCHISKATYDLLSDPSLG